jgi:hypothetical protein
MEKDPTFCADSAVADRTFMDDFGNMVWMGILSVYRLALAGSAEAGSLQLAEFLYEIYFGQNYRPELECKAG